MTVAEEDLREEAASPYVGKVIESGLTVRRCDETTTQLSFLELSRIEVTKEGIVDDNSIESWFAEVRVPHPYPGLQNPSPSNLLFRTGDRAHLPDYVYCKPVDSGGMHNANEPDTPPKMKQPTSPSHAKHGPPSPRTSTSTSIISK